MSHWHPKSGPQRKGIHPILLDGGGRRDRELEARVVDWRREHPEYEPPPARDLEWDENDTITIDTTSPWWAVAFLAILCATIVFLGYIAF